MTLVVRMGMGGRAGATDADKRKRGLAKKNFGVLSKKKEGCIAEIVLKTE